ncbi:hypothetical protein DKG77_16525 [Flagellimonas aquimarina]|uniref:Tail specific protease domain-containing protein n=1 Tax=Flagellimonas aquimarina TaxID=2201895 RepID=A0A316KZP4_9FLAO|nr:hypothetical protein [Allomuricauda koreensis]PWL37373.1 hypothetical protein DKG77_16525 [Allomuricauda koreensis]
MKSKFLAALSMLAFSIAGVSQEMDLNLTNTQWQEDLEFLKKRVESTVPFYKNEKKEAFLKSYKGLISSSNNLDGMQVAIGIQRLLNTLNDEGCNLPFFQTRLNMQVLPLKTYWFDDGLYILDASSTYGAFIGEKIVKINGVKVEDVFHRFIPHLNADNDYYRKYLFQAYGLMPSLLKSTGLSADLDKINLEFASGKKTTVKSEAISEYAKLRRGLPNDGVFDMTNSDHQNENYWSEFVPNSKTLFVQIQKVVNHENGDSFSKFVDKIETLISGGKVNRLIIDLRYGGGGNGFKLKSLTDLLRDSESINKKGNLFVLTSSATRGTLVELASILSLNTKAIVVGQPTAEGANTVGDTKYITLPNSGLRVSLTLTLWSTSWNQDTDTFLKPDLNVAYSYEDKANNRDPWINVVMNYNQQSLPKPISGALFEQLRGTYKVNGRRINLEYNNGKLSLTMSRKMKSFFEIQTELYFHSEGVLSTDIDDVFLHYSTNPSNGAFPNTLKWKGLSLIID